MEVRERTDQELLARGQGKILLVTEAGGVHLVVFGEVLVRRHVRGHRLLVTALSGAFGFVS